MPEHVELIHSLSRIEGTKTSESKISNLSDSSHRNISIALQKELFCANYLHVSLQPPCHWLMNSTYSKNI